MLVIQIFEVNIRERFILNFLNIFEHILVDVNLSEVITFEAFVK